MYEISKRTLFQFWSGSSKKNLVEEILKLVVKHFNLKYENVPSNTQKQWKSLIKDICNKINTRWRKCGKRTDRFLLRYDEWLQNGSICFAMAPTEDFFEEKVQRTLGRPPKPFKEVLHRSKKKKLSTY